MDNTGEWDPLGSRGKNDKEYIYKERILLLRVGKKTEKTLKWPTEEH